MTRLLSFFLANIPLFFPGGCVIKNPPANAGDASLIPGLGRSPEEGNGKTLQYSHLENPMDRGAWLSIILGVTKGSDTTPNWAKTIFCCSNIIPTLFFLNPVSMDSLIVSMLWFWINAATVYIGVEISPKDNDFESFGYIPRSRMTRSFGSFTFNVLRTPYSFSIVTALVYIPTNSAEMFIFLCIPISSSCLLSKWSL